MGVSLFYVGTVAPCTRGTTSATSDTSSDTGSKEASPGTRRKSPSTSPRRTLGRVARDPRRGDRPHGGGRAALPGGRSTARAGRGSGWAEATLTVRSTTPSAASRSGRERGRPASAPADASRNAAASCSSSGRAEEAVAVDRGDPRLGAIRAGDGLVLVDRPRGDRAHAKWGGPKSSSPWEASDLPSDWVQARPALGVGRLRGCGRPSSRRWASAPDEAYARVKEAERLIAAGRRAEAEPVPLARARALPRDGRDRVHPGRGDTAGAARVGGPTIGSLERSRARRRPRCEVARPRRTDAGSPRTAPPRRPPTPRDRRRGAATRARSACATAGSPPATAPPRRRRAPRRRSRRPATPSTNAASSTVAPRPMFTNTALGFIAANAAAVERPARGGRDRQHVHHVVGGRQLLLEGVRTRDRLEHVIRRASRARDTSHAEARRPEQPSRLRPDRSGADDQSGGPSEQRDLRPAATHRPTTGRPRGCASRTPAGSRAPIPRGRDRRRPPRW